MFDKNRLVNHIGKCILLLLSSVTAYYITYYMSLYMPHTADYDRRGGNALVMVYSLIACVLTVVVLVVCSIMLSIDVIYTGVDWYLGKANTLRYDIGILLSNLITTVCLLLVIYYSSVQPIDSIIWAHYVTWYTLKQMSSIAVYWSLYYSMYTTNVVFNQELDKENSIKSE